MNLPPPVIVSATSGEERSPLVVLLHGRGSNERDIISLAAHLPAGFEYAALRAPIVEGLGFAWFMNRGIGRPLPESLAETMAWFREWLDSYAAPDRPVTLVGFSGGAAFAGGLLLGEPERYLGGAVLFGTMPFDVGVPASPGRLHGLEVLVIQGEQDQVIPAELLVRTWSYLNLESGAHVTSFKSPAGHGIGTDSALVLGQWLEGLRELLKVKG